MNFLDASFKHSQMGDKPPRKYIASIPGLKDIVWIRQNPSPLPPDIEKKLNGCKLVWWSAAQGLTLTPDVAKAWWIFNTHNRPMNAGRVAQYFRDIDRGGWIPTGQSPIAFDRDRVILNGQNTIAAVIKARRSIWTRVDVGCPRGMQDYYDLVGGRTAGQQSGLHGIANSNQAAATAKFILAAESGNVLRAFHRALGPTPTECREATQTYGQNLQISIRAARCLRNIAPARVAAGCHFLFARIDRDKADDFFADLQSGSGLGQYDPIFQLRETMLKNSMRRRKMQPDEMVALFFKAWNAYREGRQIKCLRWRRAGLHPEPLPKI